jgi:hypothetical protein
VKSAVMKFSLLTMAVSALLLGGPAHAIVGGAKPSDQGVGRSVVTIVGSGGTFCSGALIAPDLVLTAGHCVQPGSVYKILEYGPDKQPLLRDTKNVAFHPGFDMKAINAHRASADVALLQLEAAPMDRKPSAFGTPKTPLLAGNRFVIAGVGVTVRGDGRSGGTIRAADLVATGQPGSLQVRLVDPTGQRHQTRPRRLHRRFRRSGVRGSTRRRDHRRRRQLVDRPEQQRRLRRPHRRHPADAVSRLDRADGKAVGFGAGAVKGALATKQSILSIARRYGLLRGACHRARIGATRWLA